MVPEPCSSAETPTAALNSDTSAPPGQDISVRDAPNNDSAIQGGAAQSMQQQECRDTQCTHHSALQQERQRPAAISQGTQAEAHPQSSKLGASGPYEQQEYSFRHLHELARSGVQQTCAPVDGTRHDEQFRFPSQMSQPRPPTLRTDMAKPPVFARLTSGSTSQPSTHVKGPFVDVEPKPAPGKQLQPGDSGSLPAAPTAKAVTNEYFSASKAADSSRTPHAGGTWQSQNGNGSMPPHEGETQANASHQHDAHACCLPLSTAQQPTSRTSLQAECANFTGSMSQPALSALDAYNKAKKFGPKCYPSSPPLVSPCYMSPPKEPPANRRTCLPIQAQQYTLPQSLSPTCIQRPLKRYGLLPQTSNSLQGMQIDSSAYERLQPPACLHLRNRQGQKLRKENDSRGARLCSKEARQEYSSSESPVSTRGLDVWRCSALETALHQVEKSLGVTGRARGQKSRGSPTNTGGKKLGCRTQSAQGTMSHILERMRRGSAQRSLRKNQQAACASQSHSKERSKCQKRFTSQERGVTHTGSRWATEQRCLRRSSSAVGRSVKGVSQTRAASSGQHHDKAASRREQNCRKAQHGARVRHATVSPTRLCCNSWCFRSEIAP